MQGFSTGAFRYYSHTQNYMRKKVESMSVKKPVVPAAAEAPAAEAKPARKTAKSAVKTEKAPKTEKTAHKGRPPLSPEIYVEFAGKQYNITDLVDRAKADYRLTHKVGVPSCQIYVKPEEEAAYYVVNKVGTLQIAICANHFGIPTFVTGAPDIGHETKDTVKIEMRDPEFTLQAMGVRTAAQGVKGYYPAFDMTPPHLISGIVTDRGVFSPFDLHRYFQSGGAGEYDTVV